MKTTRPKGRDHVAARRPHHLPLARRQIVTALEVPRLETSATRIGGADAIAVAGELDMETAPRLSEEVEVEVWNTVGAFVLDLTEVTFLDSAGKPGR